MDGNISGGLNGVTVASSVAHILNEKVSAPYFHELKIQFLRQYYSNLNSNFEINFYTIDSLKLVLSSTFEI